MLVRFSDGVISVLLMWSPTPYRMSRSDCYYRMAAATAEDADSLPLTFAEKNSSDQVRVLCSFNSHGSHSSSSSQTAAVEGAYYVWRQDEVMHQLGEELGHQQAEDIWLQMERFLCCHAYGNVPAECDPRRVLVGANVLRRDPDQQPSSRQWHQLRQVLKQYREQRPPVARDDKVICAWNGMMMAGLARAARCCQQQRYLDRAVQVAETIKQLLWHDEHQLLYRHWCGG